MRNNPTMPECLSSSSPYTHTETLKLKVTKIPSQRHGTLEHRTKQLVIHLVLLAHAALTLP